MQRPMLSRSIALGIVLLGGAGASAQTSKAVAPAVAPGRPAVGVTAQPAPDGMKRLRALMNDPGATLAKPTDEEEIAKSKMWLQKIINALLPPEVVQQQSLNPPKNIECLRNGCVVEVRLADAEAIRRVNKAWRQRLIPWPPPRHKPDPSVQIDLPPGWYFSRSTPVAAPDGKGLAQLWAIQYPVKLVGSRCPASEGCPR